MAGGIVFFTYEWFGHARGNFDALIYVIALDLGLAFLFVILTEPRDGKVSGVSRPAAETAARHGLGGWVLGVRWTNWRYLLPALIIVDMMVPVAGLIVTPSGFRPLGIAWIAVVAIPAVLWIRKVAIGAGRRVYVFDNGFIVARGTRCRVYPYAELADTAVWVPGGPGGSRLRVRRGEDRHLVISQETAVNAIAARVPHQKVYD